MHYVHKAFVVRRLLGSEEFASATGPDKGEGAIGPIQEGAHAFTEGCHWRGRSAPCCRRDCVAFSFRRPADLALDKRASRPGPLAGVARQFTGQVFECMKKMAPPRGRPLAEHVWWEGEGWVHVATGAPFDRERYVAGVRRRQAECEKRRYWDSSGVRDRRLQRTKTLAAKRMATKRRRRVEQLTVDQVRSEAPEAGGLKKPDVKE